MRTWDKLWVNARIITMEGPSGISVINDAAIASSQGKIVWLGKMKDLPKTAESLATEVYDVTQRLITPGLIDCHTHVVYAGQRANEFAMRLQGAGYADIAKQGGGIQATVNAVRGASEDELYQQSLNRVQQMLQQGVSTLEIKSGYGLDLSNELKMLQVNRRIAQELPIRICSTFLGAHTIPLEYKHDPESYVAEVCDTMIPIVAEQQLASSVDVFCETIAFTREQTKRIFQAAQQYNLSVKLHAEQLSNQNGAALVAEFQGLSADHLEYLDAHGAQAMAKAGTVAVLLPGAYYFLREKKQMPIDLLRQYNIPIAIASDCNPGTSPSTSLLLMLNMACTLFHLTIEEAFAGVTINAAKALGIEKTCGSLAITKNADFVIWEITELAELMYYFGYQQQKEIVIDGKIIDC